MENRRDHIKVGNKILYGKTVCPIIEVRPGGEFLVNHIPDDPRRKLVLQTDSGWWEPYCEPLAPTLTAEEVMDKHAGEDAYLFLYGDLIIAAMQEYATQQVKAATEEKDREISELRDWKESACQVMGQIDLQEVGKLLNLKLGSDISSAILPGIKNLQSQLAAKDAEIAELKKIIQGQKEPG